MSAIVDIIAREILDSRGNPTVEAEVMLESGAVGRAAVPSGAPPARTRRWRLRDGDRLASAARGGAHAVGFVEGEIFDAIGGMDAADRSRSTES
jgi:enolase